jgi:hypothetical protein
VVLAVSGGGLGIGLGLGIQKLVARFAGWPVSISPQAIALAFFFAAAIGVLFGFYPALKAGAATPLRVGRWHRICLAHGHVRGRARGASAHLGSGTTGTRVADACTLFAGALKQCSTADAPTTWWGPPRRS